MSVDLPKLRRVLEVRGLTPGQLGRLIGWGSASCAKVIAGDRPASEAFTILAEVALKLRPGALRPGLVFEVPDEPDTRPAR